MNLLSDRPAGRNFLVATLCWVSVGGVALSVWCIYLDNVINNDGIEYIRAAESFVTGNWQEAISVWKWPFFPVLIALLSQLMGIGFETAAHILNTLFFNVAVIMFVLTVRALGGETRRLTVLAALIALTHPAFNEYRSFVIRDPGYLAGYMVALYFLARAICDARLRYFAAVVLGLVIASLFRIEGLVLLFFSPLLIYLVSRPGIQTYWMTSSIVYVSLFAIVAALIGGFWLQGAGSGVEQPSFITDPISSLTALWDQITDSIDRKIAILQRHILGSFSPRYAYLVMSMVAILITVFAILSQMTIPWFALLLTALRYGSGFRSDKQQFVWVTLLILHLVMLLVFVQVTFIAVDRYALGLTLTALLAPPFLFDRIPWRALQGKRRVVAAFFFLWAAGEGVSGLDNATRHSHLKVAGAWLAERLPHNGTLITNDRRIAYYAGRHQETGSIQTNFRLLERGLRRGHWADAAYVAILASDSGEKVRRHFKALWKIEPNEVFQNERTGDILVYRWPPKK